MRIAVVGGFGVGMTMQVDRIPGSGETMAGGRLSIGPGGKGSNQAIGARRLGAQVALLSAVGSDQFGIDARRLWQAEGVQADSVITTPGSTMAGFILVEPDGENRILLAEGALLDFGPTNIDACRSQIQAADLVVVSLEVPLATAIHALQVAHELGTRTLLNPAPAPSTPIADEVWQTVDYVTPNRTEVDILLGPAARGSSRKRAEALQRRTGTTVILTLGAQGAIVVTADATVVVPAAPSGPVVDSTGAGDAFTAALAVGLAGGEPLVAAVRYAALAGAHAVGIRECVPALPYRADLQAAALRGMNPDGGDR
ncbi:MAG: ribokinase [Candidatus Limnocylindrales bacterium]